MCEKNLKDKVCLLCDNIFTVKICHGNDLLAPIINWIKLKILANSESFIYLFIFAYHSKIILYLITFLYTIFPFY